MKKIAILLVAALLSNTIYAAGVPDASRIGQESDSLAENSEESCTEEKNPYSASSSSKLLDNENTSEEGSTAENLEHA